MAKNRKVNFMGTGYTALAKRLCLSVGMLGVMGMSGAVYAQVNVGHDGLDYVVQPGDTLYDIADVYLDDAKHWFELAQNAGVAHEPRHLQPGQVIRLPLNQLRYERKELRVAFQRGSAMMIHNGESRPLARDMVLVEGQTIQTGPDGFVSLELPDGSRLYLSADTRLRIAQFRHVPDVNKDLVEFLLEDGHVESTVAPQGANSRFQVSTPLAVTGVRGTRFGVSFSRDMQQQSNDVTDGAVALMSSQTLASASSVNTVTLRAGQGAVFNAQMAAPAVSDLLPAPDLSILPEYIHSRTWRLPLGEDGLFSEGYAVRISPVGRPDEVIFESRGELEEIPLPEQGRFQLQVRGLDSHAVPGAVATHDFQMKLEPLPPLLQTPGAQGYVGLQSQRLFCTNVPGAERYFLQVATDVAFETIVAEQVSVGSCQFDFKPTAEMTYYWRVASVDADPEDISVARGEFSVMGRFVAVTNPPVPNAAESNGDQGIILYWPAGAPQSIYQIEVSKTPDFSDLVFSGETEETQIALGFSYSCDALYVRMRSVLPNGVASNFSTPRVLHTAQTWCNEHGVVLTDGQGNPLRAGVN